MSIRHINAHRGEHIVVHRSHHHPSLSRIGFDWSGILIWGLIIAAVILVICYWEVILAVVIGLCILGSLGSKR